MVSFKIAATLVTLSIATVSVADTSDVKICEDTDLENCTEFPVEIMECVPFDDEWNDKISSFETVSTDDCVFFQHSDCTGYALQSNGEELDLSNAESWNFDKRISSVQCRGPSTEDPDSDDSYDGLGLY